LSTGREQRLCKSFPLSMAVATCHNCSRIVC